MNKDNADDPMAVYEAALSPCFAGRDHANEDALRALASFYETKGMRRAAEIVQNGALIFSCCQAGCRVAEAILSAAAELERKP